MKDFAERINLDVNFNKGAVEIEIPIDLLEHLSRTGDKVMLEVRADSNVPFLSSLNVPILISRCFNDMREELEDEFIDKHRKEIEEYQEAIREMNGKLKEYSFVKNKLQKTVQGLRDDLRTKQEELDSKEHRLYAMNDSNVARQEYIRRLEDIKKNFEVKIVEQQKEIDKGKRVIKEVVDMAVEMTHFLFDRALNKED